jgi:hypothetical protein
MPRSLLKIRRRDVLRGATALAAVGASVPRSGDASDTTLAGVNRARRIAIVGDSYVGNNATRTGGSDNISFGTLGALNIFAGWPFDFGFADQYMTGGGKLVNIMSHLPQIVAQPYGHCVVQGCHNDFLIGRSIPECIEQYEQIVVQLQAAHITPVIVLGPPIDRINSSNRISLDQVRRLTREINVWKRQYCKDKRIPFWDWATPMSDPRPGEYGFRPGMTDDSVHPNMVASIAAAQQGLIDLAAIIPPARRDWLQASPADLFNPVNHPSGNLLVNGGLFEKDEPASGGISGGGGNIPAGYKFSSVFEPPTSGQVTCSLPASKDGVGNWFRVKFQEVSGGGSLSSWLFHQPIIQGQLYIPGDVIEAAVEFAVSDNSPLNTLSLTLTEQNSDKSKVQNWTGSTGNPRDNLPSKAYTGVLRTNPLTVPPASTGSDHRLLWPQIKVGFNNTQGAFTGTVAFRRFTVRKISAA